ncbi:MAG: GGDEF domain-containing protein [Clostridia bacterium]
MREEAAQNEAYRRIFAHRTLGFTRLAFVVLASAIMALQAQPLGINTARVTLVVVISLAFSLARLWWPKNSRYHTPMEYLDLVIAFTFIAHTGGASSPLLPGLLLFAVGVTLHYGALAALVATAFSVAGLAALHSLGAGAIITNPSVLFLGRAGTVILAGLQIAALAEMEKRLREAAQKPSVTDPLTGLLNRRYLMVRMEQEIARRRRYGGRFAILFMDVDGLKKINDRFGHTIGDQYLSHLTHTLSTCVRSGEDLARYGGDEFVLLMPGANGWEARRAAQRLNRRLKEEPFWTGKVEFPLRMSMGIAEYPLHGRNAPELVHTADHIMHREKMARRPSASSTG